MKISKLFHWLYCSVMFLPLFVLPIFALAVRSDNNFQPIEVQFVETDVVDFNQNIKNGNFYGTDYWDLYGGSLTTQSNLGIFTITGSGAANRIQTDVRTEVNNYFILKVDLDLPRSSRIYFQLFNNNYNQSIVTTDLVSGYHSLEYRFLTPDIYTGLRLYVNRTETLVDNDVVYFSNVQLFNLTSMFGSGNEPSIEIFNSYFSDNYYDYTLSQKLLIDIGSVSLNDTDFGSQTIYTLYKEVDDYFNYDDVLSIGELYEWCNINLFNGNATLGFFIFWHLLIYWLLTSLLWLLFDVLMYVPQLIHRWLDKASVS